MEIVWAIEYQELTNEQVEVLMKHWEAASAFLMREIRDFAKQAIRW